MKFVIVTIAFGLLCACHSGPKADKTEQSVKTAGVAESSFNYDLSKPAQKWVLPKELKEISGCTWIDKNHLLVIEDLHPNLYLLRLDEQPVIEKVIPFQQDNNDKKFDIEDVTIANNTVYALWSHGVIYKITNWQGQPQVKQLPTSLNKKNNTEGICFDPVSGNLLIACKDESDLTDEKKSTRAIYAFDIQKENMIEEPFLTLHKKDFKSMENDKIEFFPSAIAVHPVTHDIYVLSTRDTKCMAQYSHDGKLKGFQYINRDEMLQPEGICFAPDGTLYISSEGKHGEHASIFRFNYKK
ncbi:MAG TPA: SdiA-regulated domain-containing protein [Flavisolibacter sp.]|nr:SdiA-regulated domain-containing protein [Flavisolibacter sp.]